MQAFSALLLSLALLLGGCAPGAVSQAPEGAPEPAAQNIIFEEKVYNPNAFAPSSQGGLLLADLNTGISLVDTENFSHIDLEEISLNLPAAVCEWEDLYYIADYRNNRIAVIDQNGALVREWTHDLMSDPEGITVDEAGSIYVASYGNGYILKFDEAGALISAWNQVSSDEDLLIHPHGIFYYEEALYVTELYGSPSVIVYDCEGKFLLEFGDEDAAWQLEYPTSLFVKDGQVLVADAVDAQIKIFDLSGKFLTAFGEMGMDAGQFYYPYGVGVDEQGYIYVGDTHNRRIQIFDRDYTFLKAYDGNTHSFTGPVKESPQTSGEPWRLSASAAGRYADDLAVFDGTLLGLTTKEALLSRGLMGAAEPETLVSGLNFPYSIAAGGGRIFVVDEPGALLVYDGETGLIQSSYSLTSAQFDMTEPLSAFIYRFQDVAVDAENREIAIANTLPGTIVIFDMYGSAKEIIDTQTLRRPTGIALHDGTIYCADMAGAVYQIDRETGEALRLDSPLGFYQPFKLAVHSESGQLAVTDPYADCVQFFDLASGSWEGYLDGQSLAELKEPRGIVYDEQGNLYISCKGSEKTIRIAAEELQKQSGAAYGGSPVRETASITKNEENLGPGSAFMALYGHAAQKAVNNWAVYTQPTEQGDIVKYDFGFSWLNFNLPVAPGYGNHIWPNGAAHYALLNHYQNTEASIAAELAHARWLLANVSYNPQGVACWKNEIQLTIPEVGAGYMAASTQAAGAAALIQAAQHAQQDAAFVEQCLTVAKDALKAFDLPITGGGVKAELDGEVFYADYFNAGGFTRYDMIPFIWTTVCLDETELYGEKYRDIAVAFWKSRIGKDVLLEEDILSCSTAFGQTGGLHMTSAKWAGRLFDYYGLAGDRFADGTKEDSAASTDAAESGVPQIQAASPVRFTVSQARHPLTVTSVSEDIDAEALNRLLETGSGSVALTADSWILFYLGGASEVTNAALTYAGTAPAQTILQSTDYAHVNNYGQAAVADGDPAVRLSATFLLLRVSEPCTLSGVSLTYTPSYPAALDEEGEDVLSASDPANPLRVYRQKIPAGVAALAEELTAELPADATAHEKILVFMDYIAAFQVGTIQDISIDKTCRDAIGACGFYSSVLATLCVAQKLPARLITLGNYPENTGHAVAEIFVDGRWCLYDPTFGAYYTTTPENAKTPYVLSFEELRSGRGDDDDVTRVVGTEERLTSDMAYGFSGPEIYEKANPAGPIGPENPLFYPLTMDMAGDTRLTSDEFTTAYQGISYLGAAGVNNNHIWTLQNLTPGQEYRFIVTGSWVSGDSGEQTAELSASLSGGELRSGASHTFSNDDPASMAWEIAFVPRSTEATLTLTHPYRGPDFRYVFLSSFELRPS